MSQWVLFGAQQCLFLPPGSGPVNISVSFCRLSLKVVSSAASNLKQSQHHFLSLPCPQTSAKPVLPPSNLVSLRALTSYKLTLISCSPLPHNSLCSFLDRK